MADYFYNPTIQNIAMVKNDTMSFGFQIQGLGGQTPTEIYFTCKENPSDRDYLFQKVIGNGVDLKSYDAETDTLTYTLRVAPSDTENIEVGRYFYDLEIHINKDTYTMLKGRLSIDWEVTSIDNEDPEPPARDGDQVYYPVETPVGALSFTELYISEIGQGILDINGKDESYRTVDMISALEDIKDDIDDIREALDFSLDMPLSDIAAAILALDGDNISY